MSVGCLTLLRASARSSSALPLLLAITLFGRDAHRMSYCSYSNSRPDAVMSCTPGRDFSGTGIPASARALALFENSDRYSSRSQSVRKYMDILLFENSRLGRDTLTSSPGRSRITISADSIEGSAGRLSPFD